MGFVASVAIGEAMGDSAGGGGNVVSFFYRLKAEVVALASASNLFFDDAPTRASPFWKSERERKQRKNTRREKIGALFLRGKDKKIKVRMPSSLSIIESFYKWKLLKRRWTILRQFS